MECQPSDGICFESQAQETLAVPTTTMSAEVKSAICVVCLNEIQISGGIKEEGLEPEPSTSFNLFSCIGINAPEVPYDSLILCDSCISFVNEWASAQEEILMLRSRCSQIKARLLSLIVQSTSKGLENEGPSPASKVLRNAVSREYSARVYVHKLEEQMTSEEEDKVKHEPEEEDKIQDEPEEADKIQHEPEEEDRIQNEPEDEDKVEHEPEDEGKIQDEPEDEDKIQHEPAEDDKIQHEPEESAVAMTTVDNDEMPNDPDVRIEDLSDSSSNSSVDEFQGHVIPGPSFLNLPKQPRRDQKVTPSLLSTIVSHLTNNSDRFDENSSIHRFTLHSAASMNKVTKTTKNLSKKKNRSWSTKKRRSKRRKKSHVSHESSNTYSEISDLVEIDLECPEIDDVSVKMEPFEDDDDSTSQDKSYPFSDSLWSSLVPDEMKPDLVSLDQSISNDHVVDDIENNTASLNDSMEAESTPIATSIPVTIVDESWIKTEPPDVPPQCEAEL